MAEPIPLRPTTPDSDADRWNGIASCRLLEFPKISDHRGSLSFIEGGGHVPFDIRRVYYLFDIPADETRAGHAHLELEQVLVALSGSFVVTVDDGRERRSFSLGKPWTGLYIPPRVWREINDFSSGAVCLALASERYDENDYIRGYGDFLREARRRGWIDK